MAARRRLALDRRPDALHSDGPGRRAPLIARYAIDYVVAGPIEQTTYGDAGAAKWDQLGRKVYAAGGTTVWALVQGQCASRCTNPSPGIPPVYRFQACACVM